MPALDDSDFEEKLRAKDKRIMIAAIKHKYNSDRDKPHTSIRYPMNGTITN